MLQKLSQTKEVKGVVKTFEVFSNTNSTQSKLLENSTTFFSKSKTKKYIWKSQETKINIKTKFIFRQKFFR